MRFAPAADVKTVLPRRIECRVWTESYFPAEVIWRKQNEQGL